MSVQSWVLLRVRVDVHVAVVQCELYICLLFAQAMHKEIPLTPGAVFLALHAIRHYMYTVLWWWW